jgi:hypothetical protein
MAAAERRAWARWKMAASSSESTTPGMATAPEPPREGEERGALRSAAVEVCEERVERNREAGDREEAAATPDGAAAAAPTDAADAAAAAAAAGCSGTAKSPSVLSWRRLGLGIGMSIGESEADTAEAAAALDAAVGV